MILSTCGIVNLAGRIYRAGLLAVPKGQSEAARSLGMTHHQTLWHVLMPQAFRTILPPSTNDFIALFKDTSLVSIISAILVFGLIRTAGIWALTTFVTRPSAVALVYGIPAIATLVMLALILDLMPAAVIRLLPGRRPAAAAVS